MTGLWFWSEDDLSAIWGLVPSQTPLCGWPMFGHLIDEFACRAGAMMAKYGGGGKYPVKKKPKKGKK